MTANSLHDVLMAKRVKCYLCKQMVLKDETEVSRYRVPSATRGGTIEGVNRYVRKCKPYCVDLPEDDRV